ncbi:MAG: CBS domain-containing protein [Candidatus Manganitrophus sp.]|nr:MAG: CBS domain-containing protein [Candidatus Manganitrophus sp.]
MTKPAITVPFEASSAEIMKVMEDKHLIRVAVVDEEGKLVGMLARRDLMKGYLQSQVPDKVWWM